MNKLIVFLATTLFLASSAQAVPLPGTPQSEILYRVHLGRADDVKLLLGQEVSPNLTNDDGIPLLSLAAMRKDKEAINIMQVLVDAGADINGIDAYGQTALFHAARVGNKNAVMFLLNHDINYYIVDNNGDIARNIAHRQGYEELLTAMDDFVKNQSEERKKEYEAYNQALQERYNAEQKMMDERTKEREDAAKQEYDETVDKNETMRTQYQKQIEDLQKAQQEKTKEIVDKRNAPEFEESLSKLAFHTCAFQYWSYCKSLKQTTEIKGEELDIAIDTHYSEVSTLTDELVDVYQLKKPYLDKIITSAKKRIFNRLNKMPSKTYRFEHGVGKMEDMNERCSEIAKYWNNAAMAAVPEEEEESGSSTYNQSQSGAFGNIPNQNYSQPKQNFKKKKKPRR